jgi:hypothetical protein
MTKKVGTRQGEQVDLKKKKTGHRTKALVITVRVRVEVEVTVRVEFGVSRG